MEKIFAKLRQNVVVLTTLYHNIYGDLRKNGVEKEDKENILENSAFKLLFLKNCDTIRKGKQVL